MPIYMDVHIVPGVKAKDVAEAHQKDMFHQGEHGCKCMTYWIDEQRENIFCLIEAPRKEDVEEMHRQAHGLIPNKIIEVNSTLVESFLGRIYDPNDAQITADGLKVFADPSFRILLVTKTNDPVLLQHIHGAEKANDLFNQHNFIVRKNITTYNGREVEHEGTGFIASFTSASKAVACALAIQNEMHSIQKELDFKIAINAGEPVEKSSNLFGDTIEFAKNLCSIMTDSKIALSASVKAIVSKDFFQNEKKYFSNLSPNDESLLKLLFDTLEEYWQNADFDLEEYCRAVAMSNSQLYRKTLFEK